MNGTQRQPRERAVRAAWVACVHDGHEHVVTHAELAGRSQQRGRYRALCGHVVMPGALGEAPGPPCARCRRLAWAHPRLVTPERAREWRQRRERAQHGPTTGRARWSQSPVGTGLTPTSPVPTGFHPAGGEG
ncbi:hypothetical protein [Haloechinothrix sp. LS1_15]|uniref:hypothetical protein n=1 Tax=Haloechinothrix sp. LS1_15 TaxID=2652248 RepID=UPI002948394D|nr:hypothetical protein [Haloechinothrix sp. LS1_15]MDV6012218.1 hypothetical protein [Haloechinothrix sp. LS1_15]